MKYIKLLLVVLVILTAVSVLMGHQNNMPIMFIMLAISHAVNGWERYHKNKIEGIVLWTTAIFTAIFSVSLYFNMPIMFIMLAISHAVNGWERYHKNKIEGIVLWTTAIFTAIFSVSLYFF